MTTFQLLRILAALAALFLLSPAVAQSGRWVSAVLEGGDVRVEYADGIADPNQRFQAGSIAKYACTLAALRLQQQERLDLDAPLSRLIPEFQGPYRENVTLRHLLANRAGIADGIMDGLRSDPNLPRTSMDPLVVANRYLVQESVHPPDTRFEYFASNWILVQAALEHAAGAPLASALRKQVFEPAVARGASVFVGRLEGSGVVDADGGMPIPDFISCAGGLQASVFDLLALMRWPFVSGDFSPRALDTLTRITTPEQAYTLGGRFQRVRDAQGQERLLSWQTGNNGPWRAMAIYDPSTDRGWAMLAVHIDAEQMEPKRRIWLESSGLQPLPRE